MEMDINALLSIGIVGAGLSGVIELIKTKLGTSSLGTKFLTIVLAVGVGAAVYFLQGTPILAAIVGILAVSQTVYAFLLK